MDKPALCLVEDDLIMGESLVDRFELEGFEVDWHKSPVAALAALATRAYAVVISDFRMPEMSGEELFRQVLAEQQIVPPFIFITGYGSIDKAVQLLRMGASDYITKPFDLDALVAKVQALAPKFRSTSGDASQARVLGISAAMRRIEAALPRIAGSDVTVLVTGESGVGKEVVARHLHALSGTRAEMPFVAVNCGAITRTLLEAELFGHEKGAFTGAAKTKSGVFEQADGGTLLLDEIGEMPLDMQVNLLRVIQERAVKRVGGERSIPVDVRIVCATNRDLLAAVKEGSFREDLFYRINGIQLHIPPLRERREDILWFADLFLENYRSAHGDAPIAIDRSAEHAISHHPWNGNLRELKHSVERACVLSGQQRLTAKSLISDQLWDAADELEAGSLQGEDLSKYLKLCEREFILRALEHHAWHVIETAEALGISRKNLWEKMKKLNIEAPGKT